MRRAKNSHVAHLLMGLIALSASVNIAAAQTSKPAKKATQEDILQKQLASIEMRLKDNSNFELERPRLQQLWHWVLAWKSTTEAETYRSIFTTLRCMELAGACEGGTRQAGWKLMQANPQFASAAVFLWSPKKDQIPEAIAVGLTLERKRPKDFEGFANLAAAMCAVRDRPLAMQLNENAVIAAPAADVFDFFVLHGIQKDNRPIIFCIDVRVFSVR